MKQAKKKASQGAVPVVVRLPRDVVTSLDERAAKNYSSRSEEVRRMLVSGLKTRAVA